MPRHSRRILVFALLISFFAALALWQNSLYAANIAQGDLDDVWERVRQSGTYKYSAGVTQTNTPQATIINAGSESKSNRIFMEGETDLDA